MGQDVLKTLHAVLDKGEGTLKRTVLAQMAFLGLRASHQPRGLRLSCPNGPYCLGPAVASSFG